MSKSTIRYQSSTAMLASTRLRTPDIKSVAPYPLVKDIPTLEIGQNMMSNNFFLFISFRTLPILEFSYCPALTGHTV